MLQVLGPLLVATPGTPVRSTTNVTANAHGINNTPTNFACHAVLFQALPGNTGKVYLGTAGLVRATLAGVMAVLAVPTANAIPAFSVAHTLAPAGITLSDIFVDADVTNDGVLVTVLVT